MSLQEIIGVCGTATIEVADVERLMLERDDARAERDRARALAARLEEIIHRDHELLFRALEPHASHVAEEQLGFEIASWLDEVALVSIGGAG